MLRPSYLCKYSPYLVLDSNKARTLHRVRSSRLQSEAYARAQHASRERANQRLGPTLLTLGPIHTAWLRPFPRSTSTARTLACRRITCTSCSARRGSVGGLQLPESAFWQAIRLWTTRRGLTLGLRAHVMPLQWSFLPHRAKKT